MSAATWKQNNSGGWHGSYSGITMKILVDPKSGRAAEIQFFVQWKLQEAAPVDCTVDEAQSIALKVTDSQIANDPHWAAAERKFDREKILRR
jgi:hypothetical protein